MPSNLSSNLSLFDQNKCSLPNRYAYIILGAVAILSNAFVILVYLSKKKYSSRFALFIGLAAADLINGSAFFISGLRRVIQTYNFINVYKEPIVYQYMCASEVGNALWVIGSQWAALITLILGFERFVAVKWPIYYMNAKKNYTRILLISLVAILISLTIALCLGFFIGSEKSVEWACSISSAYGHTYSTFNFLFPAFAHSYGFTLNIIALKIANEKFKKSGSHNHFITNEIHKIRLLSIVCLCSVILVVIPNFLLWASRFFKIDPRILGWVNCTFALRSSFNIIVLGFANNEFLRSLNEIRYICSSKVQIAILAF